MTTPVAWMSTQPRMSLPSITVFGVVMDRSPVITVNVVPAGTPVFEASGNPLGGGVVDVLVTDVVVVDDAVVGGTVVDVVVVVDVVMVVVEVGACVPATSIENTMGALVYGAEDFIARTRTDDAVARLATADSV